MSDEGTGGPYRAAELVRGLEEFGFLAVESARSCSGAGRPLPDVIAAGECDAYVFAARQIGRSPARVSVEAVAILKRFAERLNAAPLVGVRSYYQPWTFFHPRWCPTAPGGKELRVDMEFLHDSEGLRLEHL